MFCFVFLKFILCFFMFDRTTLKDLVGGTSVFPQFYEHINTIALDAAILAGMHPMYPIPRGNAESIASEYKDYCKGTQN